MPAVFSVSATVLSVSADQIVLAPQRPEACARCARGEGCGAGTLLAWWPAREWQMPRPAALDGLQPGDRLQISLPERHLLQASLILYGLPLLLFAVVAVLAAGAGSADAGVAGLAFAALLLAIWAARMQARRHVRGGLRIVPVTDAVEHCD